MWICHCHATNLIDSETPVQQLLREHRKTFCDWRVDRLSEVRRDHATFWSNLTNRRESGVPRSLPRIHGREAVLDEGAHLRKLVLFFDGKVLRRKLRMRDQYSLCSHLSSGLYE